MSNLYALTVDLAWIPVSRDKAVKALAKGLVLLVLDPVNRCKLVYTVEGVREVGLSEEELRLLDKTRVRKGDEDGYL